MTGTGLSNSLADLAERVKTTNEKAIITDRAAIEVAIETGHLLCQAKDACGHGDWYPFLERAGVHERRAARLMQIARSGLKSDTVSEMGGVKGAISFLAARTAASKKLNAMLDTDLPPNASPFEFAIERLERFNSVVSDIGGLVRFFDVDHSVERKASESPKINRGSAFQDLAEGLWRELDHVLDTRDLRAAYANAKNCLDVCERRRSPESLIATRRAFAKCMEILAFTDDFETCSLIASDEEFSRSASRIHLLVPGSIAA